MKVKVYDDRKVHVYKYVGTQNESNITELKIEVPEKYQDFNKKIVFVTKEKVFWDIIENDTYMLTKTITKYGSIKFYIWLTKDEQDFRSEEKEIIFNCNTDANEEITEEEINGINKVLKILDDEVVKVTDLEKQVTDLISNIQNKLENGEFNGENGANGQDGENGQDGKSAYEIWLENGNTGTEQDFLNSLHGENGKDGQDGKNGENGQNGLDGHDGQDGYTPVKGTDYWTATDKEEIVTDLKENSNFVQDESYVHTDNNFTSEEKEKLNNLNSLNNQWELINTIKVEEDAGHVICNADSKGNDFAYKEIKILGANVLGTTTGNFGVNLYNHKTTENSGTRLFTGILFANPMNASTARHFFAEFTRKTNEKRLWFEGCYKVSTGYTATKNETIASLTLANEYIKKIDIYFSGASVCSSGTFKIYGRKKVS